MGKKIFSLVILMFSLVGTSQVDCDIRVITASQLKQKIKLKKGIQLLDVRTLGEYNLGYIESAKQIDFFADDFAENCMKNFNKEKPIYLYCKSGGRSKKASKVLSELGFTKIYDLKGGYLAWLKEN